MLFWDVWGSEQIQECFLQLSKTACGWPRDVLDFWTSPGLVCMSQGSKGPDILELTIPHRQRDRCIMPTRCSPRPVWCLQMRTWDPDWTHHLAKAKQTEKNVGLESAAQRRCHKFQNAPGAKYSNKQNRWGEGFLPRPIKCTCWAIDAHSPDLTCGWEHRQGEHDSAVTWGNVAKGPLVHLGGGWQLCSPSVTLSANLLRQV